MAINNTVQGFLGLSPSFGVQTSTPATIPGQLTPSVATTPFNGGTTANGLFSGTSTPNLAPTPIGSSTGLGSLPGLVNPHPTVGTLSTAPVATHTVTTDGSGGTTTKVTYANPEPTAYPGLAPGVVPQTPEQIAAATGQTQTSNPANASGQSTTGNQTPFNATTLPTSVAGLVGANLGQAQGYYNQQTGLTQQAENLIGQYTGLEGALAASPLGGGGAGIGSAKLAQLGALENSGLANIGQQQATLAGFEQPITSAYGTAIGAAQPTGNFPFVFNPLTGTFTSSGGGATGTQTGGAPTLTYNPQQDASTLAGLVIGLKIPYADAINAMGYAGSVGTGLLQTAIAAQGGNLTNIEAQQGAIQSNIQTAGTAGVQAANTAYNSGVQNVAKATASYTGLTGLGSNLTNTLAKWSQSGILTNLNQGLNTVAGLTSNPDYAQFSAAILNTQAAFSAAFQSAGITPTQNTQNALQELNPNSSASTILASLNQLSSDVHAAIVAPAYQQQSIYGQQLGVQ